MRSHKKTDGVEEKNSIKESRADSVAPDNIKARVATIAADNVYQVLSLLSTHDLGTVARINKQFKVDSENNAVWEQHFKQLFLLKEVPSEVKSKNYKNLIRQYKYYDKNHNTPGVSEELIKSWHELDNKIKICLFSDDVNLFAKYLPSDGATFDVSTLATLAAICGAEKIVDSLKTQHNLTFNQEMATYSALSGNLDSFKYFTETHKTKINISLAKTFSILASNLEMYKYIADKYKSTHAVETLNAAVSMGDEKIVTYLLQQKVIPAPLTFELARGNDAVISLLNAAKDSKEEDVIPQKKI